MVSGKPSLGRTSLHINFATDLATGPEVGTASVHQLNLHTTTTLASGLVAVDPGYYGCLLTGRTSGPRATVSVWLQVRLAGMMLGDAEAVPPHVLWGLGVWVVGALRPCLGCFASVEPSGALGPGC